MREALFRLVNDTLRHPVLDRIMPVLSDKDYLVLPGIVAAAVALWLGGRNARTCVVAVLLTLALSDTLSEQVFKPAFGQLRPYAALEGVHLHRGGDWVDYHPSWYAFDPRKSYAFPSTHATNMAALAGVLGLFYRRTLWVGVPLALLVGYSRVYTGNHYPGDVLAGFALGAACAWAGRAGGRWLFGRVAGPPGEPAPVMRTAGERTFLGLLALWTLWNVLYIHASPFTLAGDEAQYWDWSRRMAAGYYSKPPLIAWLYDLLTSAGGNDEWSIRSGAALLSAITLAGIFGLTRRITGNDRAALGAAVAGVAMPSAWVGSFILTPDAPLAACWVGAMYTFYRAQEGGPWRFWPLCGLLLGLGLLAKYTMLLLIIAFAVYLVGWRRPLLRTRGPWAAAVVALACLTPVVGWNLANDWVSVRHTANIGAEEGGWNLLTPVLNGLHLIGGQALIVSPILLAFLAWGLWWTARRSWWNRPAAFLALCGLTPLVFYAVVALRNQPQPQWPVCAWLAGCVAFGWAWTAAPRPPKARAWLVAAVALGVAIGLAARSTEALYWLDAAFAPDDAPENRLWVFGATIEPGADPTNQLVGPRELGEALGAYVRTDTLAEGPFLFADRYQLTALAAFYTPGRPRTYCAAIGDRRLNQYDLWGGWDTLEGRDGILVTGGDEPRARLYIEGLRQRGYFDGGEVLERVDIHRGRVLIRSYTISRLENYSGKAWFDDAVRY